MVSMSKIGMGGRCNCREEIASLTSRLDAATRRADEVERAAKGARDFLAMLLAETRGVDGWHRNGDIAHWGESGLELEDQIAALDAALRIDAAKSDGVAP